MGQKDQDGYYAGWCHFFVNFKAYPLQDFNAYSLGNFATEEEAEAFRQELIKLGLTDLWITSYKSGERILLNK